MTRMTWKACLPLLALGAMTACGSQAGSGAAGSSSAGGSVRAHEMELTSGLVVRLRSITPLSTRNNHDGDEVRATSVGAALSEHGDENERSAG